MTQIACVTHSASETDVAVHKYRRIEDVPDPTPARSALAGIEAACRLSQLSLGLGRRFNAPRGVHRFRSIEEADAHRRSWELPPNSHDRPSPGGAGERPG